jgi:hypothetical protein
MLTKLHLLRKIYNFRKLQSSIYEDKSRKNFEKFLKIFFGNLFGQG